MEEMNETQKGSKDSASKAEQNINTEQPADIKQAEIPKQARMWAMFCHLAGLAMFVPPGIGNIVCPLIIWQVKKEDYPFVDNQGKEAVNFQISMSLYALVGSLVCFITCIGVPLIPVVGFVVGIVDLIFLLIAAVKANNGQSYRYPLTIRFIK